MNLLSNNKNKHEVLQNENTERERERKETRKIQLENFVGRKRNKENFEKWIKKGVNTIKFIFDIFYSV